MDIVLNSCDKLFLDSVYTALIPASAFVSSVGLNASTSTASQSTWFNLISHLPHPPLPVDLLTVSPSSPSPLALLAVSAWPRDYVVRQVLSLSLVTLFGAHALYFLFSSLSYYFIFNHEMMKHPRFLENQVRQEIMYSLKSMPVMSLLTVPWFLGEVLGYSKLYDSVDEYGWPYLIFSVMAFLMVTDYSIYWIHRMVHLPLLYKHLHKPHHKWIIPTPWAAFAFHPVDGYTQSIPYHLFVFLFPLHRYAYLGLFVFVNLWTIIIHDSDMITGHWLENIINGPAHHTLHHLYFTVNYGQYFTWADKMGQSYRQPEPALDPYLEVQASQAAKEAEAPGKSL